MAADDAAPVFIIALCDGARCAGLRSLGPDDAHDRLRAVAAVSESAVFLCSSCLGPCSEGAVAVVGYGRCSRGRVELDGSAQLLTQLDLPGAGAAAARWIAARHGNDGNTCSHR